MSSAETIQPAVVSVDQLATIYMRIRDKKREITTKCEEEVAELDRKLDTVLAVIKDRMLQDNCQSMKLTKGTAYITRKTKYYATDWDAFKKWMVENDALDMLEKRVAQGNIGKWFEQYPDKPPIGIHADPEITVVIRKT